MNIIKSLLLASIATISFAPIANADINRDIAQVQCTMEAMKSIEIATQLQKIGMREMANSIYDAAIMAEKTCSSPMLSTARIENTVDAMKTTNDMLIESLNK